MQLETMEWSVCTLPRIGSSLSVVILASAYGFVPEMGEHATKTHGVLPALPLPIRLVSRVSSIDTLEAQSDHDKSHATRELRGSASNLLICVVREHRKHHCRDCGRFVCLMAGPAHLPALACPLCLAQLREVLIP